MARKTRPITADDLYNLVQIGGISLSADGESLAFTIEGTTKKNKRYRHIYLSTGRKPPRQFTRGEVADGSPEFSKDGGKFYFLSSRADDKSQLFEMPIDGGEPKQVTSFTGGSVAGFKLSPDGRHAVILFVPQDEEALEREKQKKMGEKGQEEPKKRHITRLFYKLDGMGFFSESRGELHYISLRSGKGKRILDGKYEVEGIDFTPDGKSVVFCSNRDPEDPDLHWKRVDLWKISVKGGKPRKIEAFAGPKFMPSVSPDGKWVSFVGEESEKHPWGTTGIYLYKVAISGGKPVPLTKKLDRIPLNVSINDTFGIAPTTLQKWSPDGKWLYFMVSTEGSTHLYRVDAAGGSRPLLVLDGKGVLLDFAIDFERGVLHYLWADSTQPGNLYSAKLSDAPVEGGSSKPRYEPNKKLLGGRDLGKVESFIAGKGASRVHGFMITPPDFNPRKKYPAILEIHGGPRVQYSHSFMHEFQYLAGLGYVVFYSNPRGGQGYGVKHVASLVDNWGGPDFEDVMSFTDHVLRTHKFIDREHVGVTGGSYGGYMTCWIVGHTDRFKAAVTQRCVSNLVSFAGSSDVGFLFSEDFGGGNPWVEWRHYAKMSPIYYAENFRTPCLVIHSENDLRCPIEQGEQFYVALKFAGVDTEFVRFPQESHGLSRGGRTDRRIERLSAISGWFDKYLKERRKGKKGKK